MLAMYPLGVDTPPTQMCVDQPFSPHANRPASHEWCPTTLALRRAWVMSRDLPRPSTSDEEALKCIGDCSRHQDRLAEWIGDRVTEVSAFGQLLGASGDGITLAVPFTTMKHLLGGVSTRDDVESKLEKLFNAWVTLTLAAPLHPQCCEAETGLKAPYCTEPAEFDGVIWNEQPNYLAVIETTRMGDASEAKDAYEAILGTIGSALRIPRELTGLNVHWKLKQKIISAAGLLTLNQDKLIYVILQIAPHDEPARQGSGSLRASLTQEHIRFMTWPSSEKSAYVELQRGILRAAPLRTAFAEYAAFVGRVSDELA